MAKGYSRYSLLNAGTDRAGRHPHADRDLRLQGRSPLLARSDESVPTTLPHATSVHEVLDEEACADRCDNSRKAGAS